MILISCYLFSVNVTTISCEDSCIFRVSWCIPFASEVRPDCETHFLLSNTMMASPKKLPFNTHMNSLPFHLQASVKDTD